MERKFNLYYTRPENAFGVIIEVPEDWDDWDEDDRLELLDNFTNETRLRWLEVEEYDESTVW